MTGKFLKVSVQDYLAYVSFSSGIICNNPYKKIAYHVISSNFGKPNANTLRCNESTWKYLLKHQDVFLTLYDYNEFWSLGFIEMSYNVPDYSVIKVFAKMLHNYLNVEIESILNLEKLKQANILSHF